MSKGDFIETHRQIADVRQMVMILAEKVEDLSQQVSYLRKLANSHSVSLAAVKKARPSDTAATETAK